MSTLHLAETTSVEKPYWGDARAWDLLAQVVDGKLSVQAMCDRQRLRREDVHDWLRGFHRSALIAFDEQLRHALIRQGAAPEALAGPELTVSLADISIIDWIQAIQLFDKGAVITVMHDMTESRLWCSKGGLIDAESGRLSGEAALYRIVSLERGQVVTELRSVRRERTIRSSTSGLLLEAARRKDESAMLRRRLGDLDRYFQAVDGDAPSHSLNTAEVAVLRLFAEPRRLSEVLEDSELGDVETLAALESLIRTGHLRETRPEPGPMRSSGREAASGASQRVLPISFAWPRQRETPRRDLRWLLATLAMASLVSLAAWLGARTSVASVSLPLAPVAAASPLPATYSAVVRVHPPGAALEVDGRKLAAEFWSARLPRDGTVHELRVTAAGFMPARVLFVDAPPPLDITLEPLPGQRPLALEPSDAELPSPAAVADEAPAPQVAEVQRVARPASRRRNPMRAAAADPGVERPVQPTSNTTRKKKPFVQIIGDSAARAASARSE
jgi:hypothetical protein